MNDLHKLLFYTLVFISQNCYNMKKRRQKLNLVTKANNFIKKLQKHHVNEYSIQCAYYVILSFIPFLILLFSLIQFTNISKETIFFWVKDIFPGNISEFIEGIIMEASFKSIGTLSISIIFTLWSAGKGFFALCKGFDSIYETPKSYNYWFLKLKSIICIIIFIVMIIAVVLIVTFGGTIVDFLQNKYMGLNWAIDLFLKLRAAWQILGLFLVFWLMYRFVPNHKTKFKNQILGALFSAIAWYLLSWGFSLYLEVFRNFSIIYGSLTSIMLLMIWVYWSMYILLLGAEINSIKKYIYLK